MLTVQNTLPETNKSHNAEEEDNVNTNLKLRIEDFSLSELLDSEYVNLNRERAVILCNMCELRITI